MQTKNIPLIVAIPLLAALSVLRNLDIVYQGTIVFMLLFPFLDSIWEKPKLSLRNKYTSLSLMFCAILLLFGYYVGELKLIISTLLLVALPEEWFFRAYLMERIRYITDNSLFSNYATSIVFTLLHLPNQGWFGILVIFPSLFFGWVYQKSRNIILTILLHASANIFFVLYLKNALS